MAVGLRHQEQLVDAVEGFRLSRVGRRAIADNLVAEQRAEIRHPVAGEDVLPGRLMPGVDHVHRRLHGGGDAEETHAWLPFVRGGELSLKRMHLGSPVGLDTAIATRAAARRGRVGGKRAK